MKFICGLLFGLFLTLPLSVLAAQEAKIAELPGGQKYIANQILITNEYDAPVYQIGHCQAGVAVTGVRSVDELCRRFGVIRVEPFYPGHLRKLALVREVSRIYIFTFADDVDPSQLLADFEADPNIELAELCYIPIPHYIPNDPRTSEQWYLSFTHAYEAWDTVRGDTTRHSIIGIVDTGVHWEHPDLAANIWINPAEDINHNGIFDAGDNNGVDDDNNGFVDDVVGWDFGNNDNRPVDDALPHGTPVAGCASEVTDNSLQGAAIGFSSRIMCVKVFSDAGGLVNAYNGIIYAADNGAQVINCSWGTTTYSQTEQNLINAAWAEGALIIASAGGLGDTTRNYPAGYNHVMAVAATDNLDHRAQFSGYGRWVDICAPGTDILTTFDASGFQSYSGTSFSAGMVSGLAGLVCARHPDYTNDQIENAIEQSADTISNNNGLLGAGRINCARAVNLILSGTEDISLGPEKFTLYPNYPNPFNAQTIISYNLPEASDVTLNIYDLLGRKVGSLISESQEAGPHSVIWDAKDVTSGIYYYRLNAGNCGDSRRCLLIK